MSNKGLFLQNIIALIWDFDRTLSPHYMQRPLFEAYGVNEAEFWEKVNALPDYYARAGITVQRDTCYLGYLLSCVQQGVFPDLTNARLRELGAKIEFFPGIPELFDRLKAVVEEEEFLEGDLHVEHYIVSTGLAEMIRGSRVYPSVDGVYACEFIEVPAGPDTDLSQCPPEGPISQIAGFLDNTTKTRALFEINKGVNVEPSISVNDSIPEDERRVPFKNMIYIADGPSDIPSFSVVSKHGGLTYAVYDPQDDKQFEQVREMQRSKRVEDFGPADYEKGSHTSRWLDLEVRRIARRIMRERQQTFKNKVHRGPHHIDS